MESEKNRENEIKLKGSSLKRPIQLIKSLSREENQDAQNETGAISIGPTGIERTTKDIITFL